MGEEIVVTGMGAVTPLGTTLKETWEGLVAGRSGIGPITRFHAAGLPCRIAGEVRDFTAELPLPRRETAALATAYGRGIEKIVLLHVLDLATVGGKEEAGRNTAEEAGAILDEADAVLTSAGVPKEKIQPTALYGDPVEAALDLIVREEITLVMLGRRGRSAIEDLIIGGVSNTILHRCQEPTIGVVCTSGKE